MLKLNKAQLVAALQAQIAARPEAANEAATFYFLHARDMDSRDGTFDKHSEACLDCATVEAALARTKWDDLYEVELMYVTIATDIDTDSLTKLLDVENNM